MLLFDGAAGLLLLALWLFCLVDVIVSDEYACRNLPKMVWFVIVLILPDVGSLLWLILGRPQGIRRQGTRVPASGIGSGVGGRYRATRGRYTTPTNPDDDEAFLQQVRIRAEQQRKQARDQQPNPQLVDPQLHEPQGRHEGGASDDSTPGRE
ncbi:MAG: PLD nuclease N-terminal domain-containing protein [Acidothermaceae bacterium]